MTFIHGDSTCLVGHTRAEFLFCIRWSRCNVINIFIGGIKRLGIGEAEGRGARDREYTVDGGCVGWRPGRVSGERGLSHSVCKVHGPRGPASSRGKKRYDKKMQGYPHFFLFSRWSSSVELAGCSRSGEQGSRQRLAEGGGRESLVIGE